MARGSVVKKGTNYYCVYRLNGKQKWESAGSNKKLAEKMMTEIMSQINKGTYQEIKEIAFKDFAEKWLRDHIAPRVKETTYRFYEGIIRCHLVPSFGECRLTSISTHQIEEYLARAQRETNLSPTSIGYDLRVLKTMLKRAVIWGYLARNPAEHISKPRQTRKEMDFLTPSELRELLANVDPRHYPLFLTAVLTGMRRGELLALKWSDINWSTSQIHIRRSLSLGKMDEPKSNAGVRVIIVPPILISVLQEHHLTCPIGELDLVFPNRDGEIIHAENLVRRHFLPALTRAGLRRIRFHDLRHTYASLLIAQGENIKFIQQQLGHSSAQVTLDRYGHLMPQVQQGAGERLQNSLFGPINIENRCFMERNSFHVFEGARDSKKESDLLSSKQTWA